MNIIGSEHRFDGQVTRITDALTQTTELLYSEVDCARCGGGVDKLTDLDQQKPPLGSHRKRR